MEETLVGFFLPAFTKVVKRRVKISPKFYFFDVGVTNCLLHREYLKRGTAEYGHAFEHFIIQELVAYIDYSETDKKLTFWHTLNNAYEVDAVIGNAEVAIEIKSSANIVSSHLKGLKAFQEEYPDCKLIVVSLEERPRLFNGVEVYPAIVFLERLWSGKILK